MSNVALQVQLTASGTVAPGSNVIFNQLLFNNGTILYNPLNGVVTFTKAGLYQVNWWVSTQSPSVPTGLSFALFSSMGDYIRGTSPINVTEVTGIGLVNVTAAGSIMYLVNDTSFTLTYASNVPVKASMTISSAESVTGPTGPTGAVTYTQLCRQRYRQYN